MKAYSEDLHQKIVQAMQQGVTKARVARLFNVSLSSVKRYARMAQQGEALKPRKGSGRPPKAGETESASLLSRSQSNRGSLFQDQGHAQKARGSYLRGARQGNERGDLRGQRPGCQGFL